MVAASPFLLPLLRVLGGDPATRHLASALVAAEQRKAAEAAESAPKRDSGSAAFTRAHDALRKAEKMLSRAKDERVAAEAKLAKFAAAETKALDEYQKARERFDAALAVRMPDAQAMQGAKDASLGGPSCLYVHGQYITVDGADGQAQAAINLLLANAAAQQAVATAAAATAGDGPAASEGTRTPSTVDVVMERAPQAEKRKAEAPLDDGREADQTGAGLAERLAGACNAAAAALAAQRLQGGTAGR